MLSLNLPSFDYKLKKTEGKLWIFDVIRKKYVALIPEEWVRQHFVHYLIGALHYPRTLMKIESGLKFNQLHKRSDIVVYDRNGKPWMLVECKSPEQPLNAQVIFQASVYNTTLRARYIVITNGLHHVYSEVNWESGETSLLDAMPVYGV